MKKQKLASKLFAEAEILIRRNELFSSDSNKMISQIKQKLNESLAIYATLCPLPATGGDEQASMDVQRQL